ncbi:MAG: peptidase M17, partial [Bacteroides sp.]|nr:peptidase M17 [Bacteroides sp.]
MIKKVNSIDKQSNLIYILPINGAFDASSTHYETFISSFKESKKELDFIKSESQSIFFVKEKEDLEEMRLAGYEIRKQLDKKENKLTIVGNNDSTLALAEGFMLANYQFLKYFKDKEEKEYALAEVSLYGEVSLDSIDKLNNTLKAVYWARNMVNEPVCYLTADELSKQAEKLGKEAGFNVKVLHKDEIEKLGMGGLLAVNKGSIDPPTFTIMEYKPKNPINEKPIVLVGKGIVFDTGGLSLKPTLGSMDSMKSDMGGAA